MSEDKKHKIFDAEGDIGEEIGSLMTELVLEEATQAVWQQFEKALSQLDPETLNFLESHLDGLTDTEIAQQKKIAPNEAKDMLNQVKRDLVQHLRKNTDVKN